MALANSVVELLGDETCAVGDDVGMCTEVVFFPPFPFISEVEGILR